MLDRDTVYSHAQIASEEGFLVQKGMNFRTPRRRNVFLMSVRKNAPYRDSVDDAAGILIYEGHDVRPVPGLDPKSVDQPELTEKGKPSDNMKFFQSAADFKAGRAPAEVIRVYEKLKTNIWTFKGEFRLVDAWKEFDGRRGVFKFKLELLATGAPRSPTAPIHNRIIPGHVKLEVWNRDGGKCRICGAKDNLHFDHIIPFAKGGSSLTAENIQLLCVRHNLEKSDRIA